MITPLIAIRWSILFREHLAVCPVIFTRKKSILIFLYPSRSQNTEEFNLFFLNFEQLISGTISQGHLLLFFVGDFNVSKSSWWKDNLATIEGSQFEFNWIGVNIFLRLKPTHSLHTVCQTHPCALILSLSWTMCSPVFAP